MCMVHAALHASYNPALPEPAAFDLLSTLSLQQKKDKESIDKCALCLRRTIDNSNDLVYLTLLNPG